MNQKLRKQLEDGLRAQARGLGVEFSKLELTSAAKEMGLLDQIEINYPSKPVKTTIHTSYPDPENPLRTITSEVEHTSRVMMSQEEAIEYHAELAKERLFERFAANPAEMEAFLKELGKKSEAANPGRKPGRKASGRKKSE